MNSPSCIVIAPGLSTRESRIVSHQAMLRDIPRVSWTPGEPWPSNAGDHFLPVGSVEFLHAVMSQHGVRPPGVMGFPHSLSPWFGREIFPGTLDDLGTEPIFVKPRLALKSFTGFVYQPGALDEELDASDLEQLRILRDLPPATAVWTSPVVRWQCEWRYYIREGKVVGAGRYDPDGDDDAPEPNQVAVKEAAAAMLGAPGAYALDFGVTDDGQTMLVEINDGWALGFYSGTLTDAAYLEFLQARWDEIYSAAAVDVRNPARLSIRSPGH